MTLGQRLVDQISVLVGVILFRNPTLMDDNVMSECAMQPYRPLSSVARHDIGSVQHPHAMSVERDHLNRGQSKTKASDLMNLLELKTLAVILERCLLDLRSCRAGAWISQLDVIRA